MEIQWELEQRGILVNERNVGRLYRQFLGLLEVTAAEHGGLIWAMDALQPEGCGTLLYVSYEVLSGTPVAALQTEHSTTAELIDWLQPYREMHSSVLGTCAVQDRREMVNRDLFDTWWLLKQLAPINDEIIKLRMGGGRTGISKLVDCVYKRKCGP